MTLHMKHTLLRLPCVLKSLIAGCHKGLIPGSASAQCAGTTPTDGQFAEGITVQFKHTTLAPQYILDKLLEHKQEHETLTYANGLFKFKRC